MRIRCAHLMGLAIVVGSLAIPVAPSRGARAPEDSTRTAATEAPPAFPAHACEGRTVRVRLGTRSIVCRAAEFTSAGIQPLTDSAPGFETPSPYARRGPGSPSPALLPWNDIDRVEVQENHARTGAIVGGVACGLLGLLFLGALVSDPWMGSGIEAGPALAFLGLGAGIGAGTGALVGVAVPRWRLVYDRRGTSDANRTRAPERE